MTNDTGKVSGIYTYDPYGRTISHAGSAQTNLQYDGQFEDAESGLYYLRARYYDPTTAQFLTADPLAAVTHSAYGYGGASPLDFSDAAGLDYAADSSPGSAVALPPLPSDYIPWPKLFRMEMAGCFTPQQYQHFLAEDRAREDAVAAFGRLNLALNQIDIQNASVGALVKGLVVSCLKGSVRSAEIGLLTGPEGGVVGAVEGCGVSAISQELRDLGHEDYASAVEQGSSASELLELTDDLTKLLGK